MKKGSHRAARPGGFECSQPTANVRAGSKNQRHFQAAAEAAEEVRRVQDVVRRRQHPIVKRGCRWWTTA
jgi:hypothetical protein